MGVGENIRRLRMEANLTQEELAQRLDVARSTVTQWENGWSMPRMSKLRRLAEVLHTTYSDLVSETVSEASHDIERCTVPLLSKGELMQAAACMPKTHADGITIEYDSNYDIEVPRSLLDRHAHAMALLMDNDCMNRVAPQGLAIIFDPMLKPSNGQIAVLSTEQHGLLVRRWFRGSSTIMLVSESHTKYEDIIINSIDSVQLLGTAFWIQSPHELE